MTGGKGGHIMEAFLLSVQPLGTGGVTPEPVIPSTALNPLAGAACLPNMAPTDPPSVARLTRPPLAGTDLLYRSEGGGPPAVQARACILLL